MPLFTDNRLRSYEREMQRIPNIERKGGGSTVLERFQDYTEEDCDCKLCLYYGGRKGGCQLVRCCCADVGDDDDI